MKLQQVIARTGLIEKGVLYYVQYGLVSPKRTLTPQGEVLDFSVEDVLLLEAAQTLESLWFLPKDIMQMHAGAETIPQLVTARREEARQDPNTDPDVRKVLEQLNEEGACSITALATRIRVARSYALPGADAKDTEDVCYPDGHPHKPADRPPPQDDYHLWHKLRLFFYFIVVAILVVLWLELEGIVQLF